MPGDNESKLDLGNACYRPVQDLSSSLCCLKYKDINIQDSNFARCFVWVWSLVSHSKGRM